MTVKQEVKIGSRSLALSNLEKVLYPQTGFTKGEVIQYYVQIAPVLLAHLRDRPLTLKRYPNGVEKSFFYEKQCPSHRPDWIETAAVWSKHRKKEIQFCVVNNVETLAWAANLADLELHPSLAKADSIERPTVLAFDLDPGEGTDVLDCAETALWLREILENLNLASWVKTSGSKGLQVYVPLHTAITYDETKPFAHAVARILEEQYPRKILSKMNRELRRGKIFIDWSQNDEHKTTICVYSLRARERPTVSTPVRWEELERAQKERNPELLVFETKDVLKRVEQFGDLFEPVLRVKQKLPSLG